MPDPPSWLLVSDMDGTVIPLDQDPGRGEEIRMLSEAIATVPGLTLAYATGRSLPLATRAVKEFHLPPADSIAVDVGTRIFHRTEQGYTPDATYDERMTEAVGGVDLKTVVRALDDVPGLEEQPDWGQGRFKRSYFVDPSVPDDEVMEQVRELIEAEGGQVTLVTSHDPVRDLGLLDILPMGIAKDVAVHHLHTLTQTPLDRVVYAGDSGNDAAAFLAGYAGIVVGNAPDALKAHLRRAGEEREGGPRLYFAEAPFAAGVLQGLRHYGVV